MWKSFRNLKNYAWFWFKLEYVLILTKKKLEYTQIQTIKNESDCTSQRFHDAKSFTLHRLVVSGWPQVSQA